MSDTNTEQQTYNPKEMREQAQEAQTPKDESVVIGDDGDLGWNESMDVNEDSLELHAQIAQLEAQIIEKEQQIKAQQDGVLRAKAEMENIRRRSEQEIDKARKFALNKFAEQLLPVVDNLERALDSVDSENEALKPILEGIELTHQAFISTIEKNGLAVINPLGEAFDPDKHQAMSIQESADFDSNTVSLVMQKGYELNGRVLRPAMVMVAK